MSTNMVVFILDIVISAIIIVITVSIHYFFSIAIIGKMIRIVISLKPE